MQLTIYQEQTLLKREANLKELCFNLLDISTKVINKISLK